MPPASSFSECTGSGGDAAALLITDSYGALSLIRITGLKQAMPSCSRTLAPSLSVMTEAEHGTSCSVPSASIAVGLAAAAGLRQASAVNRRASEGAANAHTGQQPAPSGANSRRARRPAALAAARSWRLSMMADEDSDGDEYTGSDAGGDEEHGT